MIYESSPLPVKVLVNTVYLFAGIGAGTVATKIFALFG